jgi:hypothetical protein
MEACATGVRPTDRRSWQHGGVAVCRARRALVAIAVFVAPMAVAGVASGQSEDDAAQELAERYAPVIMLKAQDEACDTYGEPFAPMGVDALLGNPQVLLRQVGKGDPVVMRGATAADLFELGGGFYLDFPGDALAPGCLYERDFDRYEAEHPPTVYAHIARQPDRSDLLAIQYWTYWYYNDWNNKHEGDWEFVQVLMPASSVAEALTVEPSGVGYAQHSGGERAAWDDAKLEREGTHPVVYTSARSHASYFGAALFMGRSASEGFGCDNTDGPSTRIEPEVVVLPDAVEDADDPLAWLAFDGRWGERQTEPNNGPTGPAEKARWTEPVDWHEGLRDTSFVVPAGDSIATELIGAFCGVVEWGSVKFIEFRASPVAFVLTLATLAAIAVFLVGRTSWAAVPPVPVVRRRRAGEIVRASLTMYRRHRIALAGVGLIALPVSALAGLAATVMARLPVIGDLVAVSEGDGGGRLVLSTLVVTVITVATFVIVVAAVASIVDDASHGRRPSAIAAMQDVSARAHDLGVAFVRAVLIIVVLNLTVIGIPFAIRQFVRYQFMSQSVMLAGSSGAEALGHSSQLVRGRWWHTALFVTIVTVVVGGAGLAVGVVLLVIFTGLPLWALSSIVVLVDVLVMPLAAVAMTLLYGDAVAVRQEHDADPLVAVPVHT